MIMHNVAFKLDPSLSAEEKSNQFLKVKEAAERLAYLDGVKDITVYPLLQSSEYDLILVGAFESIEALDAYQSNEEHQAFKKQYKDVLVARAAFDYNMD